MNWQRTLGGILFFAAVVGFFSTRPISVFGFDVARIFDTSSRPSLSRLHDFAALAARDLGLQRRPCPPQLEANSYRICARTNSNSQWFFRSWRTVYETRWRLNETSEMYLTSTVGRGNGYQYAFRNNAYFTVSHLGARSIQEANVIFEPEFR